MVEDRWSTTSWDRIMQHDGKIHVAVELLMTRKTESVAGWFLVGDESARYRSEDSQFVGQGRRERMTAGTQ